MNKLSIIMGKIIELFIDINKLSGSSKIFYFIKIIYFSFSVSVFVFGLLFGFV